MSDKQYKTPHKELCDQALKHYREISDEALSWSSTIEKAIEFYRKEEAIKVLVDYLDLNLSKLPLTIEGKIALVKALVRVKQE